MSDSPLTFGNVIKANVLEDQSDLPVPKMVSPSTLFPTMAHFFLWIFVDGTAKKIT